MAIEPELVQVVITAINDHPGLTAHFPGGVWEKLPQPGSGPNATPGAYWPASDPARAGMMKHTISVIDGGDFDAPNGVARGGRAGYPSVYGYAEDSAEGRAELSWLHTTLGTLFRRGKTYRLASGVGAELVREGRQPYREGDDFGYDGMVFAVWSIRAIYIEP